MDALMVDLLEDIRYPDYLDRRWLLSTNMWMGPAGNNTPLISSVATMVRITFKRVSPDGFSVAESAIIPRLNASRRRAPTPSTSRA